MAKVNETPKAKAVAKKDEAKDKKEGVKFGSAKDKKLDAAAMKKAGLKGKMPEPKGKKGW